MRIAVTGSTGLIGTALVAALRDGGHRVIRLVRQTPASEDEIAWDPLAPTGGLARMMDLVLTLSKGRHRGCVDTTPSTA